MINVRLAQLYAFRSQIDALRTQADALVALEEVGIQAVQEAIGCDHPDDMRQSTATFGMPKRFKCLKCGETLESA